MKTLGYIPCHQHRETDTLLRGYFEMGVHIGPDSWEESLYYLPKSRS